MIITKTTAIFSIYHSPMTPYYRLLASIRLLITLFIVALVLSGITALPIEWELSIADKWIIAMNWDNDLTRWIQTTYSGIVETNRAYPFISYGTDWLAFAHMVIAVVFIGPLRDPVRNIWVIDFGIIACLGIFPLAFIAGPIRGIPIFWQLIDCSFGVIGGLILWNCRKKIKRLEKCPEIAANNASTKFMKPA